MSHSLYVRFIFFYITIFSFDTNNITILKYNDIELLKDD